MTTRPFLVRVLLAGVLATMTMDLVSALGRFLGVLGGVRPELFARWIGLALRGDVVHPDIATAPDTPVPLGIALAIHYLIGIVLAAGYVALVGRARGRLGPIHAVAYGVATSVFAWLVMFPAMGFGVLGLEGPSDARLFRTSIINHLAYGLGLGIAVHVWPAVARTAPRKAADAT